MKGDDLLNTLEAIAKRRSHHEFKGTKLSKESVGTINQMWSLVRQVVIMSSLGF